MNESLMPKIVVDRVKLGGSASEYIFDQLNDIPILSYDFPLCVDADTVEVEKKGELVDFVSGCRLQAVLTFTTDNGSECLSFWAEVFKGAIDGAIIYFYPHSGSTGYEVVLSDKSKRQFYQNSFKLVEGSYVFEGKYKLSNIPTTL